MRYDDLISQCHYAAGTITNRPARTIYYSQLSSACANINMAGLTSERVTGLLFIFGSESGRAVRTAVYWPAYGGRNRRWLCRRCRVTVVGMYRIFEKPGARNFPNSKVRPVFRRLATRTRNLSPSHLYLSTYPPAPSLIFTIYLLNPPPQTLPHIAPDLHDA